MDIAGRAQEAATLVLWWEDIDHEANVFQRSPIIDLVKEAVAERTKRCIEVVNDLLDEHDESSTNLCAYTLTRAMDAIRTLKEPL